MRSPLLIVTALTACSTVASTEEPRVEHQATPASESVAVARPEGEGAAEATDRVMARHILVQYRGAHRAAPSVRRTKEEARARADELAAMVRAEGADFAAIARENSDGPSAARGGDLGSFGRGVMHPMFERTVFELPVDALSDVIETPFGFHIIQRYR